MQNLILAADDRGAVLPKIREIDGWLALGPHDFGESRFDTVRLGVVAPLAVLFDVLDDPPPVIVLDIWRF